jgi:uncharacterized repeat protein (TIGR01451 family)
MRRFTAPILVVCSLVASSFAASNPSVKPPAPLPSGIQLPLSFEPNRGQTDPRVHYLSRGREGTFFFTDQGATIAVPGHGSFRLLFEGSRTSANFEPESLLPGRSNYLSTAASASIPNVENYAALLDREVFSGIDVRFYGNSQHLEHDLIVAPGADASAIHLRLDGVSNLHLDSDGNAQFQLGELSLHETAPIAWQTVAGKRVPVEVAWKQIGSDGLEVRVGKYDHTQVLVIDPVLAYSTYLGGSSGYDQTTSSTFPASSSIYAVVVDSSKNIYLAGTTSATDFPTTSGAYQRTANYQYSYHADTTSQSGFVAKFNSSGVLVYSTFLHAVIDVLAVDSSGQAYTAKGGSDSYAGPGAGYDDGVSVDKLSADGSKLLYSYVYAQTPPYPPPSCSNVYGDSYPSGIQADGKGHVWIAGSTENPCLVATSGAYQATMKGYAAGFIAELDTTKTGDSSVVRSTYLGGTQGDGITGLALDSSSNAYVTGYTTSTDFPKTATFGTDSAHVAFISKLNSSLSSLTFSVWLEGVHYETSYPSISLDPSLNVYVAGETNSTAFPVTANAFQRTLVSDGCNYNDSTVCTDGFVTALSSSGKSLIYSTLLGGKHSDQTRSIAVNSSSIAFVTGTTSSTDFPITSSAFKKSLASESDYNAFVTAINSNGQSLYYSTLLGGSKNTFGDAIALDSAWNAYVVGNTSDTDFPVAGNAYQPTLKGTADGFLSKVVIAGDLKMTMTANTYSVPKNGSVTFYTQVTNLGPDGSDNVVMQDPIPSGWSYEGIYTTTASSCTTPKPGATSGTVVCNETHLNSGQSFYVNVYLKAIGASGSSLTNTVSTYAQTQDLNQSNNKVQVTVKVQ